MPHPAPPPLALSRPPKLCELQDALLYVQWLGGELKAASAGGGPQMVAHLLLAVSGVSLGAAFHGDTERLVSLFEAVGEWAAARPSGVAGMTCREAAAARLSSDSDPRLN